MQSQNSAEIDAQRAKVAEHTSMGDTKFKISGDTVRRKCPFKPCNKPGCRKFWHQPCTAYSPLLVRQLRQMVLAVGILDIVLSVVLGAFVKAFKNKYESLYGKEGSKIIRICSFLGLTTLILCGLMLVVSLVRDNRKIMWIRIVTSTSLSAYVVIISIMKMHFALLAKEKDPSLAASTFILSDACVFEVYILLGTGIHFFGDLAVFTYYNLRFLHPTLFYTGQVENL